MELLERHFEIALETPDGIKKLRELILSLAMQGKLVQQDSNDQPASELLKEIEAEKKKLIKEGKIKKQEPLPPIKPEEIPYEVPKGWEWVRFGTITINRDGERVPISKDNRTNIQGSYDYYGASGVIDKVNDYIFDKNLLLIGEDGTNLVNRSTPIAFMAHGKYWVNNHAHVIDGFSYDLLKYIENYINAIDLKPYVTGTAQPKMNQAKMNSIMVSLPPFAEQKRIVTKIDQLMAMCDKLEAERNERNQKRLTIHTAAMNRLLSSPNKTDFNTSWGFIINNFGELYSVLENVDELKKAILQLAVMGKLVPQDPNDQPASELLKEIEAEKKKLIKEGKIKKQEPLPPIKPAEIPYEVPKGWEWVKLGSILCKYGAGSTPLGGNKVYQDIGVIFLRSQNVWNNGLKLDDVARIDESIHEKMSGTKVLGNDILLNITGASIGRSTIYPENFVEANVSQHVAILRSFNIYIVPYLHRFVISTSFQKMIMENQVGVSREGLSMSKLKDFIIPVPPLAEQKRIVAKIDQLMELCNTLEQQINDSTNKQTAVLNAILAKL